MKIAVIGAGGVGGPFGAALAQAGHEVHFLARGRHLAAMRQDGLRILGPRGDVHLAQPNVTDDPAAIGVADLVLFTVKLWDVETSGRAIAPIVGPDSLVLPLQNGIDAPAQLAAIHGQDRVLIGVAMINAAIESPGLIRQTAPLQKLIFGGFDAAGAERALALADMLKAAAVDAVARPDPLVALWEKFSFLVPASAMTSLTRKPMGEIRANPASRALLIQVMEEVLQVGRAAGIALPADLGARHLSFYDAGPAGMMASMAKDLLAGNRLELPWLSGRVAGLGRELSVPTPANDFIHAALVLHQDGTAAG